MNKTSTLGIIKFILKMSLATILIYWLLKSGKMDFTLLFHSFQNIKPWIFCFAILTCNIALITWRWKNLLEIKSQQKFPFWTILKLTWIGSFFNSLLPGAVSGDLIKLIYARKIDQQLSKTYLLTTVILDRVIGLTGLILMLGSFSILNYSLLSSISQVVTNLVHFNFALLIFILIFLSCIFVNQNYQSRLLNLLKKLPLMGKLLESTLPQIWSIGEKKKTIMGLILLSVVIQILNIYSFWIIASPYFQYSSGNAQPLSFSTALSFLPLGFITMSIPITPSGLGIGHAAFSTLFSYFHIKNGASVFNLHFLAVIVMNLLGIFPYLSSGIKLSKNHVSEFKTAA